MQVEYKSKALRDRYETFEKAKRTWGEVVALKYVDRIDILWACRSIADLGKLPQLRFHPLKGDRKGQYAIDLDEKMRLIVSFMDEGRTRVRIEEVSKHYGD